MKKSVKKPKLVRKVNKNIPIGVIILSVLGYILFTIILVLGVVSLVVALKYIISPGPIPLPPNFPPQFINLFTNYFVQLFIVIGFVFIIIGIIGISVSRGLWKGRNWARILILVLTVLSTISNLIALFTGKFSSIISLAINGIIIWYLLASKEVQKYFGELKK